MEFQNERFTEKLKNMVLIRNRLRNCLNFIDLELLCKSKHSKGMHRSVENVQYSALHPVRDASLTRMQGCGVITFSTERYSLTGIKMLFLNSFLDKRESTQRLQSVDKCNQNRIFY